MICGVIGFAGAIEEAVAHPGGHLHTASAVALTVGAALFVGGAGGALLRAHRRVPVIRTIAVVVLLAWTPLLTVVSATAALAVVAVVVGAVAVVERAPTAP